MPINEKTIMIVGATVVSVLALLTGFTLGSSYIHTVTETETMTHTQTVLTTIVATTTQTITKTYTTTMRQTLTTTVYASQSGGGTVLLRERGSGNKDSKPFIVDRFTDLKIKVKVDPRASLKYVSLDWYLYDASIDRWIKNGGVDEEAGEFEFYLTNIPPGRYYVRVYAANCRWELVVSKA